MNISLLDSFFVQHILLSNKLVAHKNVLSPFKFALKSSLMIDMFVYTFNSIKIVFLKFIYISSCISFVIVMVVFRCFNLCTFIQSKLENQFKLCRNCRLFLFITEYFDLEENLQYHSGLFLKNIKTENSCPVTRKLEPKH